MSDNPEYLCFIYMYTYSPFRFVCRRIMVMPRQHVVQKKGTQKCLGFFLQCCPDAYSEYVIIILFSLCRIYSGESFCLCVGSYFFSSEGGTLAGSFRNWTGKNMFSAISVCCDVLFYSSSWSCQAAAELRLISQKQGVPHFTRKTNHVYTAKENDWGYSCFMTWAVSLSLHCFLDKILNEIMHSNRWDKRMIG